MKRRLLLMLWMLCCLPAVAQNLPVYTDALVNGFQDFSFNVVVDLASTTQVHGGTNSIRWQPNAFGALSLAHPAAPLSTTTYSGLNFWLWCSADCARPLNLSFQNGGALLNDVSLAGAYPGGVLPAMQWTEITISLDNGPWALAANSAFDRFNVQGETNGPPTNTMYIDDVQLIARGAGPPSAAPLAFTASNVVNGVSGSQFTWIDSTDNPRSAHMATGTGGANKGGVLNQFIYRLANNSTRTVNQTGCCGAGGFGYIVSHLADPGAANEDDSPLGPPSVDNLNGATQTLFAGRHHALHMYSLNYPRWGKVGGVNTKFNMAVKVGWIFATGRNHPLWTVSFDMNQMPADIVTADTRAPYGDMSFDGTTGEGTPGSDVIGGVGWGDLYKFRSTTAPFTLNSDWTWNTPNTIPHNMLWTQNIDSEMGIVLTQPITQQDAGGYFGINRWNSTSAAGNACAVADNPPFSFDSKMPCDFKWPFQSINYSLGNSVVNNTDSKRLAWGADFGYIGQTNYPDRPTGAPRSGYPYHSYSTYIVLDAHSRTPTDIQVAQMETRQLSSVTASVGTVAPNGLAGLGRPDTITYQPSGFDPIFDAWTFTASSNNLTASFTTPAPRSMQNPLFILRGYNLATEPFQVKVGGVTLVADRDYYASAIPSRTELWLTLRGQFQGTTSLDVIGAGAAATPALLAAQSRKTHGGAGDFNLAIDTTKLLHDAVTVEPRSIGGGHLIVFQFDQMITITGIATTTSGAVTATAVGQEVRVTLTGVADNTRATISLSGVNGNGAANVSLGFLVGDVNNTRSVNSSDISGVKARSGQATTAANFLFDVNASGAINSSDISAVKARSGLVLPP